MTVGCPAQLLIPCKLVLVILILGIGGGFAEEQPFPFFDGTDQQTSPLMREARAAIDQIRKGDFVLQLIDDAGNPVLGEAAIELREHDFNFGTNLFGLHRIPDSDPAKATALEVVSDLFNSVIVCDYWSQNENKNNGTRDWQQPDYGFSIAQKLGKRSRYHALIYGFPHWLHEYKTEEEMWQVMEQRIRNVADRYGSRITEVDVINEFINYQYWQDNPHAKYLKATEFPDLADPQNGARILKIARKHFPKAKLVVLEAGIWSVANPVFQEIYAYHKRLIELNAPYDYIGYQAHYYAQKGMPFQKGTPDYGPRTFMMDEINRGLEKIAELGKPMVITEFNAPSRNNKSGNADQPRISDEEIAAWEANFYTLLFSKPYVRGLSRWFTVDNLGGRGMDAGIVDADGRLKPNYFALLDLIKHDWHTAWKGFVGSEPVKLSGFHGTYSVKVDGYKEALVQLSPGRAHVEVILSSKN